MRRISIAFVLLVVGHAHTALAQQTGVPVIAPAPAKPKPKPAPTTPKPVHAPTGVADSSVRQKVAGGPTTADVTTGVESAELKALREAEREFFPSAIPQASPWPNELPAPMPREGGLVVHASGLPAPSVPSAPPTTGEGGKDLKWLTGLQLPDLPVRWEPRLIRYLELYKDDTRAHAAMGYWLKKSGRWRDHVRKTLRSKNVPEDLFWLAMIESGFDPTARSPAGALGMWQFMGETGRQYGLPQDRWVDHRMNVVAETSAAADFLSDLHRRFGSWELAMAAYNMGYGGLSSLVRRYNTNDYWALSRLEGSLPWETTLYVPKIIAASIVAHNLQAFGFQDLVFEPGVDFEETMVPPGTALSTVAQAGGIDKKDVETLNPELRALRTPLGEPYPVKVPPGKGAAVTAGLAKLKPLEPPLEKYVVRFGESLDQIAQARGTSASKLVDINAIAPGETIRGGMVLLVPPPKATTSTVQTDKPIAIVPADVFVYPGRKRVFYRVATGDTLPEIANALKVSVDDLRRWNDVDPSARLIEGMTLQAFVPEGTDLSKVVTLAESDVRVVPVGSDDFFALSDSMKGKKRIGVTVKSGETLESIGKRFGVSTTTMERINRRDRRETVKEGETIVVYATPQTLGAPAPPQSSNDGLSPDPLPPLPQ
jgi:membrane-bound lytic murein transglycosylase D